MELGPGRTEYRIRRDVYVAYRSWRVTFNALRESKVNEIDQEAIRITRFCVNGANR